MLQQTIAAISTPPGQGGIAVVRLSGSQSREITEKIFIPKHSDKYVKNAKGYTALYGRFIQRGEVIDDGIALFFCAPHSYTGEDVVELSCHGGEQVSRQLLQACLQAGATPAGPGEFTRRAVLNGRMSLPQAEAVMDMISATSRQGVAAAQAALSGALFSAIQEQKQKLIQLAGHLAAYTDYPEEDVELLTNRAFAETVEEVRVELQKLVDGYGRGILVRRGVRTAIVGSPNVGKSTLFNLLSGFERAIVTPVAGTTRDVVRESIQLGSITLHLADTAGLHQTQDEVEAEGIRRSKSEMAEAQLVIVVFDGSLAWGEEERDLARQAKGRPSLGIINKSDLGVVVSDQELNSYFSQVITVSAKKPEAKEQIEQAVLRILGLHEFDTAAALVANERQLAALTAACAALQQAEEAMQQGLALDAAGVCVDDALISFAELTGENINEIILENIFSRFCVGK